MRFTQLKVFCSIYKHSSVTQASKELMISQPAVSAQLQALERQLGVKLFDRVGRNIRPVPAGEMLYKHASILLDLNKKAKINIEQYRLGLSGQIILGVATGLGYCIPNLLYGHEKYLNQIKVILEIGIADDIRESVVEGDVDFGLVWGPVLDSKLNHYNLTHHEFVLVVPKNHPLSLQSNVVAEDLNKYSIIFPPPDTSTRKYIEGILQKLGIKPTVSLELPTSDSMKWAISAGFGISFLSLQSVRLEVSEGLYDIIRIKDLKLLRPVTLIHNKNGNDSAVTEMFLDYVINHNSWNKSSLL